MNRLIPPALLCLTLGLAPFTPEPHVLGKLRWVAGGAQGMGLMDWGDLLMHGAPWVLLVVVALFGTRMAAPDLDLPAMLASGAKLVDVRSPAEFASGHLDGAINMPLPDLDRRHKELDADGVVLLYCASGMRSRTAMNKLKAKGYSSAQNIGAMARWK